MHNTKSKSSILWSSCLLSCLFSWVVNCRIRLCSACFFCSFFCGHYLCAYYFSIITYFVFTVFVFYYCYSGPPRIRIYLSLFTLWFPLQLCFNVIITIFVIILFYIGGRFLKVEENIRGFIKMGILCSFWSLIYPYVLLNILLPTSLLSCCCYKVQITYVRIT